MILGVDLSHHKSGGSLRTLKEQGYSFVLLKATEGDDFIDPSFTEYLSQAREFELPVAAYHYVRSNATMESQVALIARIVPRDVPIILDVEANSGSKTQLWLDMIKALKNHGYAVPLFYLPRWYWESINQPDLSGFPPLWGSHYVGGKGYGSELFQQVKPTFWNGYGSNFIGMLQFTSSATVDGLPPLIDVSAFVGSTEDLKHLFAMEDNVTGAEVWTTVLKSSLNYETTAEAWVTETSRRVEEIQNALNDFMVEVRGKLDGVSGPSVEQITEAFRAALPNLKVTGEFHGGTDPAVG